MTPASDPYRTLGLPRGASLEDVKRAYRALAKKNHPDAAGPTALPRWLVIQAAYEQLVHGPNPARRAGPSRPTAADPDRADATHRAYGGRARATPGGGGTGPAGRGTGARPAARPAGSTARPGPSRPTGSTNRTRPAGATDTDAGMAGSGDAPRGGRGRNKATLGSTSYDGADAGQFEPDWGGASWYGTTSGTYWTINPKEYADPRKHGPEYQARARRAAAAGRRSGTDVPDDVDPAGSAEAPTEPGPTRDPVNEPAPTHTTTSWWRSTAGPTGAPPAADPAREPPTRQTARPAKAARPAAEPPPPDLVAAATDLGRALTDERAARGRWRLVQAVVGWLPIVFGIGWFIGEVTGCSRFAASCNAGTAALTPVIAIAVVGVLLLAPRLAALAAAGAVALVVAAVPTAVLLSATGEAANIEWRNTLLGVVLVVSWVVGIVVGIARRLRTVGLPSGRAGPVS